MLLRVAWNARVAARLANIGWTRPFSARGLGVPRFITFSFFNRNRPPSTPLPAPPIHGPRPRLLTPYRVPAIVACIRRILVSKSHPSLPSSRPHEHIPTLRPFFSPTPSMLLRV
ncbi:hypothetical protein BC830DRAFT_1114821 [Chytriomyces sp. MP71]|nr:hypothetical protein BC830DRAFT_1114821 [Chytriomyces sp. MP71]